MPPPPVSRAAGGLAALETRGRCVCRVGSACPVSRRKNVLRLLWQSPFLLRCYTAFLEHSWFSKLFFFFLKQRRVRLVIPRGQFPWVSLGFAGSLSWAAQAVIQRAGTEPRPLRSTCSTGTSRPHLRHTPRTSLLAAQYGGKKTKPRVFQIAPEMATPCRIK